MNGSHYTDPSAIYFTTIEDAIYVGAQNDESFLVMHETMNFWEPQSSFNPNMPLRFFIYGGHIYDKYLSMDGINRRSIYSTKLQKIPAPRCVCFYNGTDEQPEERVLRLSDAFVGGEGDIEVRVRMININYGHNKKLMEECGMLNEYAWLIAEIRTGQKAAGNLDEAMDAAILGMPEEFVLKKFMIMHRAEVKGMYLTDYNEEKERRLLREEYREEGLQEGREEGMLEEKEATVAVMLRKNLPLNLIGEVSRLSEDAVRAIALRLGITVL